MPELCVIAGKKLTSAARQHKNGYFQWLRFQLVCLLLTLTAAGCGQPAPTGDILATVPVSGVVTYKGQPIEHYQVTVFPEDKRAAAGVTDAEGKFTLGTNGPGDGAVAGTHKVSVVYIGPPNTDPEAGMNDFSPPPPPSVEIPEKYKSPGTSGLTLSIPEGGDTQLVIELQ